VRLPRPVLDFGIAPHLLQFHQSHARELDIQSQALFRLPTRVANLVDLRLRKRFAMPLRLHWAAASQ
jgi:hypothetical protein